MLHRLKAKKQTAANTGSLHKHSRYVSGFLYLHTPYGAFTSQQTDMDLHEHLRLARAKIRPLTQEEKSERGRRNVQKRWKAYYKKNPKKKPTSAPRISTVNPE